MPTQPIVIVGAGVLGLTTASLLQDKYPGARITIVAAETPLLPPFSEDLKPSADYASMWAGTHLRPEPGETDQLVDEHKLALKTTKVMRRIARHNPESGVQTITGRETTEFVPPYKSMLRDGAVYTCDQEDEFRVLEKGELNPGGEWGCEYQTWVINVHVFCHWLLTKFMRQGGNVMQRRLGRLDEAFDVDGSAGRPPLVVNCSGRNFDTDPKVNVNRGQTVLVKNTYHKTITRQGKDGSWCFIVPRPLGGGTVVGGTKRLGDWGTEVRPEETEAILKNAVRCWPEFVSRVEDFEIKSIEVGRRPMREGGMRIECEHLGQGKVVVHGYGAGSRGYEICWGAAERIADLASAEVDAAARL